MRTSKTTGFALTSAALLVAAVVAIGIPGAAQAADAGVAPLAMATAYANGVDLLPNVAYRGAQLTVSGPTMVYQRSFGAGERLSVDLFDPAGRLLPDGIYTWRLALTPTAPAARELRRAAKREDDAALERWQPQSGVFTIKNGQVVERDLVEARPARADAGPYSALPAELAAPAAAREVARDTDAAVESGTTLETRGASTDRAASRDRSDAEALAAGPAPVRQPVIDEQPTSQRSWPTEGKNGRK